MQEKNRIIKPWTGQLCKIALVYPNRYTAIAGLTVQTLYSLWNNRSDTLCERFFLPSREYPVNLAQKSVLPSPFYPSPTTATTLPPLRSIENQMPLSDFDLIAFTFTYELDFPHLCWFLHNAHIPRFATERTAEITNVFPVIIAGGPAVRGNPLPLSRYIDAFFIGEIEPQSNNMISAWHAAKQSEKNLTDAHIRSDYLQRLIKVPGFWIPMRQEPNIPINPPFISRVFSPKLDQIPHPICQVFPAVLPPTKKSSRILPLGDALFVEVNRGCPHTCRFCMTGHQMKPFRNRSLQSLIQIIQEGLKCLQLPPSQQRVVLIGSSVTDHPEFIALCRYLIDHRIEFSIPSVRVEGLTKEIASLLKQGGIRTVTIAPETGSDRLRKYITKSFSNFEILRGVRYLLEAGIPNLKLYFLYGIPTETDADLEAVVDLCQQIADLGYGKKAILISLNPLIPKTHTPFENTLEMYMDGDLTLLKYRREKLIKALWDIPQIELEDLPLEEAYLQTLLSVGDISFGFLIDLLYQHGNQIRPTYRTLISPNNPYRIQIENYLQTLSKFKRENLPWHFITFS